MKERIRTRERWSAQGNVLIPEDFTPKGPYPYRTEYWYCRDFIEKKKDPITGLTPPSDLELLKVFIRPPFLSNKLIFVPWGIPYYHGVNLPCYAPTGLIPSSPPLGWEYMEGTTEALTAELLAKSNPFRYSVSVPVMVAELVEGASLLKLASNNYFALIGSAHLNKVFGWDAMKNDIRTLAKLTTAIESRIKEFNSLVMKGGLRRKVNLTRASTFGPETITSIHSDAQGAWNGVVKSKYSTKVWGSVRWVPNRTSPVDLSKLATFNEAIKLVLDLRQPDASTIWEMIPFSWLADYFLNVGDTLQAIEDTDKVLPHDICIMRERTVNTGTVGIVDAPGGYPWDRHESISDGEVIYEMKLRKVVTISDAGDLLSFGIMTRGQATNLLALLMSLVRFKR